MDLNKIFELLSGVFDTYGIVGIIAILIVAFAIYFISNKIKKSNKETVTTISSGFEQMAKTLEKQNDKLLDAIISQNTGNQILNEKILETIITKALKDKDIEDTEAHDENMQRRLQISEDIQQSIHDLLYKYNCDRVFILEFHNNKQNLSGLSFMWYDMQYEQVARGVNSLETLYRDQEASHLIPVITDINDNDGYKIYSVEDLEELQRTTPTLYRKLRVDRELEEAIMVGLYNKKNILIGILILEYESGFIPVEVLDEEDIVAEGRAIAKLLDYKNN